MKTSFKKRSYSAPSVRYEKLSLESLLCQSLRFRLKVDPLENVNAAEDPGEPFYFES